MHFYSAKHLRLLVSACLFFLLINIFIHLFVVYLLLFVFIYDSYAGGPIPSLTPQSHQTFLPIHVNVKQGERQQRQPILL